ncbi:MAG: RagB/SusD family nutrient uptake outer membrane protein [Breznakibacter sp.]
MNRLSKYILALGTIALLNGCQKDLLDTLPYGSVGSNSMWTNENLADQGVVGVYQTLRLSHVGLNRYAFDYAGSISMWRDQGPLTAGNVTPSDGLFSDYWKQHYEGIHRANDAIVNLAAKAPLTEQKRGRLLAEVKFLRAYFYFNLNIVFKGVPVYLEPVTVEQMNKGRETEQKVWEVIINDLTDCINEANLPGFYPKSNANIGRATKAAAYALRGKAYLYMKQYALAEADFKEVGKLGIALYQGEYKMLFKEANEQQPEMIFSVQNLGLDGLGSDLQLRLGSRVSFGSCWNTYFPHPDYVESFENKDGSKFKWDDYLPGYSTMTPAQRTVFFLRDGLTEAEKASFTTKGADMTKYLDNGNEARIRAVYENRDPRLMTTVITPYSTYKGAVGTKEYNYTLRWPYRGFDEKEPFDIRTDANSKFYYLWRKWVAEGASETPHRTYCPTDMPLIRYADVLLMLAEAINEQGVRLEEAIEVVNQVRGRAGVVLLQSTNASLPTYVKDQADLRERIRNERRWELPLEGVNLFDEMRWGTWKSVKFYEGNGLKQIWGTLEYPYAWLGDYIYKWAIPRQEIEMNRNLQQNPDWIN